MSCHGSVTHRGEVSTTIVGGEASRVAETPISTVPSSDVKRTVSAAQCDLIGRRRGSSRNSAVAASNNEASPRQCNYTKAEGHKISTFSKWRFSKLAREDRG